MAIGGQLTPSHHTSPAQQTAAALLPGGTCHPHRLARVLLRRLGVVLLGRFHGDIHVDLAPMAGWLGFPVDFEWILHDVNGTLVDFIHENMLFNMTFCT